MQVLTVTLPPEIQKKLDTEKQRTGLSKSYIVRRIIAKHYEQRENRTKRSAA